MVEIGRAINVELRLLGRVYAPATLLRLLPDDHAVGVRGGSGVGHGQHHASHATHVLPLGPAGKEEVLDPQQSRSLLHNGTLEALGLGAKDIVLVRLRAHDDGGARRVGRRRGDELKRRMHTAAEIHAPARPCFYLCFCFFSCLVLRALLVTVTVTVTVRRQQPRLVLGESKHAGRRHAGRRYEGLRGEGYEGSRRSGQVEGAMGARYARQRQRQRQHYA